MVRLILMHPSNNQLGDHVFTIPIGIGLFVMVSVVVALCANHARRGSRKEESKGSSISSSSTSNSNIDKSFGSTEEDHFQEKIPPRSPLRSTKQLINTISNKAINTFVMNHKRGGGGDRGDDKVVEEGFGQGGLWQKEILMGVKCQPPEFSGVIYYDYDGHQVPEFPPRSPRVVLSRDFTFPVIKSSV
uniref:uncharacterized protein LOC122598492 n=1 Tax=Erigeron canadensis TaxID=72917 RepID=UPI001CB9B1FE|nr:uncharacterized protein LOC122598492 [Erigeron canadensis]